MPTYDYACEDCGHAFEVFATFKQKAEGLQPECPQCHSHNTQQIFRSVTFIRSSNSSGDSSMPMACGPGCGPGGC
ncbi:MAG: FmdB family zinc ribbon protein [Anaerolineae bacterium]